MKRTLIAELSSSSSDRILLKGWVRRLRETKSTSFIILRDCSGEIQVVADPARTRGLGLRAECAVAIAGKLRRDERAPGGFEVDLEEIEVLGPAAEDLPFGAVSKLEEISPEIVLNYRPLSLRTERGATIFRVEAAIVEAFRAALRRRRFIEIFSSKIVARGTEGGSNLFQIRY